MSSYFRGVYAAISAVGLILLVIFLMRFHALDLQMLNEHPTFEKTARFAVVKVFFATDRNRVERSALNAVFGPTRSAVSYGTCEVSIPRDHRMGHLESASIWRLELKGNPEKHVMLLASSVQDKDEFFAGLASKIQASSGKNALVFVHGYNTTFENAARRTAQMAYDLAFDGAPIFFSWPSQGDIVDYPVDEQNIEWAENDFKGFLEDITTQTTAENIYLIAHSMGNRALVRGFAALMRDQPALRTRFREVVLAAPDIDADVFKRDIAPRMVGDKTFITLYASSEDRALLASKQFHGYPRAGDSGVGLVVLPGIDTVDATRVDTSLLGHCYFAEMRSVLSDIFYLIHEGKRPQERFALEPVEGSGGRYWQFKR
jgi:esterase/lipase superfamily enzyme